MPKTFPTPRRAPVSKSLAWQFTVTILLTAGAFWWFRLAFPVHAMIHSPELALANGGNIELAAELAEHCDEDTVTQLIEIATEKGSSWDTIEKLNEYLD